MMTASTASAPSQVSGQDSSECGGVDCCDGTSLGLGCQCLESSCTSECGCGSCDLVLPDANQLKGIVGVGVLLRRHPCGELSCSCGEQGDDCGSLSRRTGVLLSLSGREKRKPCKSHIVLEASVIFVTENDVSDNRAVRVKFSRLRPWIAKLPFGLWFENTINRVMSWLHKKKYCSSEIRNSEQYSVQQCKKAKNYEVWQIDENWQCLTNRNINSNEKSTATTADTNSNGYTSNIEFMCCKKFNCKISWSFAGESSARNCWLQARWLACLLQAKYGMPLKHYGFIVAKQNMDWAIKAFWRYLPSSYKRNQKRNIRENIAKLEGELLEEKAKKTIVGIPCFNFWYSRTRQFLIKPFLILSFFISTYFALIPLSQLDCQDMRSKSLIAGVVTLLYYIIKFIIKLLISEPFTRKYNLRIATRVRRLIACEKSKYFDNAKRFASNRDSINCDKIIYLLKIVPTWVFYVTPLMYLYFTLVFVSAFARELCKNSLNWLINFEYILIHNDLVWGIVYIILFAIAFVFARSINKCKIEFIYFPRSYKILICGIIAFLAGIVIRLLVHFIVPFAFDIDFEDRCLTTK